MRAVARVFVSWRHTVSVLAALGFVVAFVTAPTRSAADSQPPTGVPATVTADVLPTVQIDGLNGGIVRAQAIHGTTVYAVGKFTTARPPEGVAGTAQTRTNILAFDITTGALDTSFVHSLDGTGAEGRTVAVSPDGTRLYVGGTFSSVDGVTEHNVVAFDLTQTDSAGHAGMIVASPSAPQDVWAITATDTNVYLGGFFSDVDAYTRDSAGPPVWQVTVGTTAAEGGAHVAGLLAIGGKLIIGGSFDSLDGQTYYSIGAVALDTGSLLPWASEPSVDPTYPLPIQPPSDSSAGSLGITSLRTDGARVYFGAWNFITGVPHPGSFEGTAAVDLNDGHVIMINDCAGDTHDVLPIGGVLYSVSHAHNCAPINGYPQLPSNYRHALAETTFVTGVNGPGMGGNYGNFEGQPRGDLLNWFPTFDTGTASGGADDAGWSIVGNSTYIAIGGEFLHVNGTPQQGLVRFTVKDNAPNKVGPSSYVGTYGVVASPANSLGQSLVRVFNVSDQDNGLLTYRVYRTGSSHLVVTRTLDSRFWWAHSFTFWDTHLPPGTSADYRVVVTDPLGNRRTLDGVTAVNDSDGRIIYGGTWYVRQGRTDATPDFYRGIHFATANGAYYSFSFYGRSVTIVGERGPDRGTAAVTIDGAAAGSFNAYQAPLRAYERPLYVKYNLGFARHTITVRKTGGTYLDLDAIRVTQDTSYDDPSSSFSYTRGTGWVSRQNSTTRDYGHGTHYTRHNNASAWLRFSGTRVALMTPTGRVFGSMRVSIDGKAPVTISAYRNAATRYQQIVFSKSGLANGAHTLKITKLSGAYLEIDAAFSR